MTTNSLLERAPRRTGRTARGVPWKRLGPGQIALLGMATAVGPLTIDLYLPALPVLATEFGASPAGVQLSLTAAVFGVAAGQLIAGPISDRLGRRPVLVAGLLGYVVMAVACALAPSLGVFVAARLGQGLLAGTAIVICRAVMRDYVSGVALSRALAGLMLVVGAGPVLAPALGSLLLGVTGWRGLFGALAVLVVVIVTFVLARLPESLPPASRVTVSPGDLIGTYATLLRDRAFIAPTLVSSFAFAALFAYISAGSFVFQEGYGISRFWYGVIFGTTASCLILGNQISPRLIERVGAVRVLRTAPLLGLLGASVLTLSTGEGWATLPVLVGLIMLIFVTIGICLPAGAAMALTSQPPSRAGLASGLVGVTQFAFGGAIAPIVGLFGAESATVMALTMAVALAMAAGVARLHRAPRSELVDA